MKKFLFLLVSAMFFSLFAENPDLLFEANYDTYSQHADFAKGDKKAYGFPENDLQLRMFPGIPGKSARNSLELADTERVYYKAKGNFNAAEGTLSFWLKMVNYDLGNNVLQSIFAVYEPGYYFRIIKNKNVFKDFIIAQIYYKNKEMSKPFSKQVQVYTRPLRWKKGEWHHIAVTWNKKEFRLYLDGVLHPASSTGGPRMNHESKVIPYDHPSRKMDDFEIPQISSNARMYVGNYFSAAKDGAMTAYDNLQLFNRPLSASEIKKMYEEVIPPPKKEVAINFAGIPFSEKANEAVRCFMNFPMAKPEIKYNAYADLRRDAQNLYVKFVSDRPCKVKKIYSNDGKLWEDDSFEIHLKAPDNNNYQFIVNGNGAIFDSKNKNVKWNASGVTAQINNSVKGWTADLTIPLKNLSALQGRWAMDVCSAAVTGRKTNYYRWSNRIFDGSFTATGEMEFLPKGYFFTVDKIGALNVGNLDLSVRSSKQFKVTASYLPISGYRNTYSGDLKSSPWKMTLPAGEQTLNIEASAGKILAYRYQYDYYVDFPMEITFNTATAQKKLEIGIDFANAGGANLAKIRKTGISGTISLKDKNGKVCSENSFQAKTPQCRTELELPADLTSGEYTIEAKADDMLRIVKYRVPNLAPYIEKVSHDANVPEPWTAVQQSGRNSFKVWNRVYSFNGKSPFPQQVTAAGKNLLAEPVKLVMNGKTAIWEDWKITGKRNDRFCFAGKGVIDGVPVAYESELWFDGMYLIKWNLDPAQKHLINNMKITYRMPSDCAEYVYTPEMIRWQNGKAATQLTPIQARRNHNILWLSGYDKGFLFWVKSNANWVNKSGEKPLTAQQNGKFVNVSMNIITRKAELAKKAEYTMVFQGTPSRPLSENFREVNYLSYGGCSATTHELANVGSGSNRPRIDDSHVFNGCYPRDFAAFAKVNAKRKVNTHMYTTPGHLSDYAADFDYWDKKFLSKPGAMFSGKKLGVSQMSYLFCSNATDAPADLWSWWCDDAMKKLKNYNGLYFDLSSVKYCENVEHGCAGIDAFGQKYISNDALGLRNFFLRCYKTCHKNGGDMMIHCHLAYTPFTHITDFFAPGENTCDICRSNYNWAYCENIPLDAYQSDYNQYRTGVAFKFILQNGRAVDLTPSMKHINYRTDTEMTLHSLTPMIVHDISVWGHYANRSIINKVWLIFRDIAIGQAEFVPYWRNNIVTTAAPKTYGSWYKWQKPSPYKVMIAVGNFARDEQNPGLKIDWKKLGVEKPQTVRELWTGREIPVEEIKNFKLKGGHFALFGVK